MTTTPAIGETVINWYTDGVMSYNGHETGCTGLRMSFDLRNGTTTKVECDPAKVAPSDVPIPEKDTRAVVIKHDKKPNANAAGPWALTLPDADAPTWHKTKRDALTAGMRRLAILDHVATRTDA